MPTYVFKFPAAAAGRAVTVRDAAGSTVDTGTVGAASGVQGEATYSCALAAGSYVGEAANAGIHFTSRAVGVIDLEAAVVALQGAVAAWVDPASVTFEADLVAALVAAGLMADEA